MFLLIPAGCLEAVLNEKKRQRMPFKDLREFIAKLEEEGEAIKIEEEVDWNLIVNSAHNL